MRAPITALLAGSLLLTATLARADEKADALLKEVVAATKAAQTLAADLEMTADTPDEDIQSTGKVRLKKPNRAHITMGGPIDQVIASDGTNLYVVRNQSKQYQKAEAHPQGRNINPLWALPVVFFLNPSAEFFQDAESRYAGKKTLDGVNYDVVELIRDEPSMTQTLAVYIGPDKLFRRSEITVKRGDETIRYAAALKNVQSGKPIPDAEFTYTPPQDAALYEPPSLDATLIPVGQEAPKFTLPTPQGGQLALENTLKGKKAVLVNFWFYN